MWRGSDIAHTRSISSRHACPWVCWHVRMRLSWRGVHSAMRWTVSLPLSVRLSVSVRSSSTHGTLFQHVNKDEHVRQPELLGVGDTVSARKANIFQVRFGSFTCLSNKHQHVGCSMFSCFDDDRATPFTI